MRIHRDSLMFATRVRLTIKKRGSTISRWSCKTIRQPRPMSSPMVVAPAASARQVCLAHALGITWYGREEDSVELWIVPRGAIPPQPTPTVQAGDVRPAGTALIRRGRRRGRD